MISSSEATLPRSRCKIRSATRRARARQRLSECARARGPARRRIGRPRCCGALRCSRCNHRGSRGRAGTADSGKRARNRKSRNRRARRGPRRRSSDHDISATLDQARCVFARRLPFSLIRPRASGGGGPPCAAGWWRGRRRRRNFDDDGQSQMRNSLECFSTRKQKTYLHSFSFNDNEAALQAPPPPRFARCASSSGPPPPLRGGGCTLSFSRCDCTRVLRQERKPLLFRLQIK